MMLGTYTSDEEKQGPSKEFKDHFVEFFQSVKSRGFQLFWKGHPNGDHEGQWIKSFISDGYSLKGVNVKPSPLDIIVLDPAAASESLGDLRDNIVNDDKQEFSWDGYGVAVGDYDPTVMPSSAVDNLPKDKFLDAIYTNSHENIDNPAVIYNDVYASKKLYRFFVVLIKTRRIKRH